jgi:hypothetical protein
MTYARKHAHTRHASVESAHHETRVRAVRKARARAIQADNTRQSGKRPPLHRSPKSHTAPQKGSGSTSSHHIVYQMCYWPCICPKIAHSWPQP